VDPLYPRGDGGMALYKTHHCISSKFELFWSSGSREDFFLIILPIKIHVKMVFHYCVVFEEDLALYLNNFELIPFT
jgi:hypothetical protein